MSSGFVCFNLGMGLKFVGRTKYMLVSVSDLKTDILPLLNCIKETKRKDLLLCSQRGKYLTDYG